MFTKTCRFAGPHLLFSDTPDCRSGPAWGRIHPPVEPVCCPGF